MIVITLARCIGIALVTLLQGGCGAVLCGAVLCGAGVYLVAWENHVSSLSTHDLRLIKSSSGNLEARDGSAQGASQVSDFGHS